MREVIYMDDLDAFTLGFLMGVAEANGDGIATKAVMLANYINVFDLDRREVWEMFAGDTRGRIREATAGLLTRKGTEDYLGGGG